MYPLHAIYSFVYIEEFGNVDLVFFVCINTVIGYTIFTVSLIDIKALNTTTYSWVLDDEAERFFLNRWKYLLFYNSLIYTLNLMQCEVAFIQSFSSLEYLLTQLYGSLYQAMQEHVPFCCVSEPEATPNQGGDDKSAATTTADEK